MLEPPTLLSAPQIQPRRSCSSAPRGCELPHRGCSSSEEPHSVFLARGSAPSRSSAGTAQAVPGGGDASVPAVAAFPERVLARRASVLGSVSPDLGQAPASLFLPGRETPELHRGVGPVWLQRSPLGHCRGVWMAQWGSMFWDGHPRDAGRCWAVGGSLVPAWRCPWLSRGEIMAHSH